MFADWPGKTLDCVFIPSVASTRGQPGCIGVTAAVSLCLQQPPTLTIETVMHKNVIVVFINASFQKEFSNSFSKPLNDNIWTYKMLIRNQELI